jgi:AcrR family transcriptional regulator
MTRPAQQKRSQATERRLLDAAEALIDAEGLAGLSIAEVVRRARSSVGSFYNRFGDKDGLLQAIHARRLDAVLTALDTLAPAIAALSRPEAVELCMTQVVAHFQENHALTAAFNARSSIDPEGWAPSIERHVGLVRRITEILDGAQGESAHPQATKALELGLHLAFAFLGNRAVYGADYSPFDAEALPGELTRMVLRYWEVS